MIYFLTPTKQFILKKYFFLFLFIIVYHLMRSPNWTFLEYLHERSTSSSKDSSRDQFLFLKLFITEKLASHKYDAAFL